MNDTSPPPCSTGVMFTGSKEGLVVCCHPFLISAATITVSSTTIHSGAASMLVGALLQSLVSSTDLGKTGGIYEARMMPARHPAAWCSGSMAALCCSYRLL